LFGYSGDVKAPVAPLSDPPQPPAGVVTEGGVLDAPTSWVYTTKLALLN